MARNVKSRARSSDGSALNRLGEICLLVAAAVLVHALVLTFVFPGYYDPLWPQHSDMYVANAARGGNLGFDTVFPHPRPFTQLLLVLIGGFDTNKVMLVLIGVSLFNIVAMGRVVQIWLQRPMDWIFVAAFLAFSFLILAHPYYYTFSTWDFPSTLSLGFLLLAVWSYLGIANKYIRYAVFTVFVCSGFLAKETYTLSFPFVMAAFAARDIASRRPIWNSAVPFLAIASLSAVAILLRSILRKSPFTSGGGAYAVDLNPLTVAKNFADYMLSGLPGPTAITLFLVSFAALVFVLGIRRTGFAACVLFIAGLLTLVPNSVLSVHFFPGYSWNAAMLLFAPILLIPDAFAADRSGWKTGAAFTVGFIALTAVLISAWQAPYKVNQWTLQNEARQKRLLTSIRNFGADPSLKTGPVRILVSGLAPPFSPFDHGTSMRVIVPRPNISFDVVAYDDRECCGAEKTYMKPVRPQDVDWQSYDVIWAFKSDGSGTRIFPQATYPSRKDIPFTTADMVLYPDLQDVFRWPSANYALTSHDWTVCGLYMIAYQAPGRALECLERAKRDFPQNSNTLYYAGRAWELSGDKRKARENYQAAISLMPAGSMNLVLDEALKRVQE